MKQSEIVAALVISVAVGLLMYLSLRATIPRAPEGDHSPQHLSEYGLVRYENHEVICYRAEAYEGFSCKWKEMPAGSYCKLPEAK